MGSLFEAIQRSRNTLKISTDPESSPTSPLQKLEEPLTFWQDSRVISAENFFQNTKAKVHAARVPHLYHGKVAPKAGSLLEREKQSEKLKRLPPGPVNQLYGLSHYSYFVQNGHKKYTLIFHLPEHQISPTQRQDLASLVASIQLFFRGDPVRNIYWSANDNGYYRKSTHTVSLSQFPFTKTVDPFREHEFILTHELMHALYSDRNLYQEELWESLYGLSLENGNYKLFYDRFYLEESIMGHPWEDPGEFFASAAGAYYLSADQLMLFLQDPQTSEEMRFFGKLVWCYLREKVFDGQVFTKNGIDPFANQKLDDLVRSFQARQLSSLQTAMEDSDRLIADKARAHFESSYFLKAYRQGQIREKELRQLLYGSSPQVAASILHALAEEAQRLRTAMTGQVKNENTPSIDFIQKIFHEVLNSAHPALCRLAQEQLYLSIFSFEETISYLNKMSQSGHFLTELLALDLIEKKLKQSWPVTNQRQHHEVEQLFRLLSQSIESPFKSVVKMACYCLITPPYFSNPERVVGLLIHTSQEHQDPEVRQWILELLNNKTRLDSYWKSQHQNIQDNLWKALKDASPWVRIQSLSILVKDPENNQKPHLLKALETLIEEGDFWVHKAVIELIGSIFWPREHKEIERLLLKIGEGASPELKQLVEKAVEKHRNSKNVLALQKIKKAPRNLKNRLQRFPSSLRLPKIPFGN